MKVYEDGTIERPARQFYRWNGHIDQLVIKEPLLLTPTKNGKAGYYQVKIHNNKKSKSLYVHRLVWIAFNGEIPEGFEVDHLDNDKSNNGLLNLGLKTRKENMNKMLNCNPHVIYNLKNQI